MLRFVMVLFRPPMRMLTVDGFLIMGRLLISAIFCIILYCYDPVLLSCPVFIIWGSMPLLELLLLAPMRSFDLFFFMRKALFLCELISDLAESDPPPKALPLSYSNSVAV